MILGVCSWIASSLNIDVTLVRILFVIATIIGFGSPIIVYLILYVIKEFKNKNNYK